MTAEIVQLHPPRQPDSLEVIAADIARLQEECRLLRRQIIRSGDGYAARLFIEMENRLDACAEEVAVLTTPGDPAA